MNSLYLLLESLINQDGKANSILNDIIESKSALVVLENDSSNIFELLRNKTSDDLFKICQYFDIALPNFRGRSLSHSQIESKIAEAINLGKLRYRELLQYCLDKSSMLEAYVMDNGIKYTDNYTQDFYEILSQLPPEALVTICQHNNIEFNQNKLSNKNYMMSVVEDAYFDNKLDLNDLAEYIKLGKLVKEDLLLEFVKDSPIKLKGDDVFINNKLVGRIINDLSNLSTGIIFRSTDGKMRKEFNSIKELYTYLIDKFAVKGELPLRKGDE